MQSPSYAALCHPLPADLGIAYPGQMVSTSFLVWRSDGEAIEHFLVSPPAGEMPPGLALYPRREDARHCRVDVFWLAPTVNAEPGFFSTVYEIVVDGAAITVPVRMWLMPARVHTLLPLLPLPLTRTNVARTWGGIVAVAAFSVVFSGLWMRWGAGNGTSERPAVMSAAPAAPRDTRFDQLRTPGALQVSRPLRHFITSVQKWRGIAVWHVGDRVATGQKKGKVVIDTGRRAVQSGDALVELSTRKDKLPAAIVFQNVGFAPQRRLLRVENGGEERVVLRHKMERVPARLNEDDLRRCKELRGIAAFLRDESARAGKLVGGVEGTEALRHYRETFRADVPFHGELRAWHLCLADAFEKHGGAAGSHLSEEDLRLLASEAQSTCAAIRPTPVPPREVTRAVRVHRVLDNALLLAPGVTDGSTLRPVRPDDSGLFYTLSLSPPITVGKRQFTLLLSPRPFAPSPSRSLPRYVVRPDGVVRLEDGSLPAGASGPALLIPGAMVPVTVIDDAQTQPAGSETAPEEDS